MLNSYFLNSNRKSLVNRNKYFISKRKNRLSLSNIKKGGFILNAGDIISILFWNKFVIYQFEGLLLSVKKSLRNLECSLVLRNIIFGVGIEYTVSYYYNRIFFLKVSDYKRKRSFYRRSKLYFVRSKRNRASRVK